MKNLIKKQLRYTLNIPNWDIPYKHYHGKVRDNYYFDDKILMVTTDRVSAFDHVLGTIPFKGHILSEIARFWFKKTTNIVPNHYIKSIQSILNDKDDRIREIIYILLNYNSIYITLKYKKHIQQGDIIYLTKIQQPIHHSKVYEMYRSL